MTKARFKIIPFHNPSGKEVFRVSGCTKEGKQIRENFPTMTEATIRQQALESEFHGLPTSARLTQTRLTQAQIEDAEIAYNQLGGRPLAVVVRYYLENFKDSAVKTLLSEARKKFIESKEAGNNRPDTIRNLKYRIDYMVKQYPAKQVHEVSSGDVSAVINRSGRNPVTRDNDRRAFSSFFSWCVKQGFCSVSPVDAIEPIKTDREEPDILPLEGARMVLQAAREYKGGVLMPYIALGLFCAIRPTELARLTWKEIDLEAGTVTIGSKLAKMRQRRIVSIPKNAINWLLPHALEKTPLVGKNFRRNFDRVKVLAGYTGALRLWTADIMRHTGISYHLAKWQHEGKTATWAGNSPDIIQKHYKGLVKPKDAKEFWEITPAKLKSKIILMKAA